MAKEVKFSLVFRASSAAAVGIADILHTARQIAAVIADISFFRSIFSTPFAVGE